MSDKTIRQIAEKYAPSYKMFPEGTELPNTQRDVIESAIREAVALARQQAIEECALHITEYDRSSDTLRKLANRIRELNK